MTAIRAVAPPGGWSDRVHCMATIASATAMVAAISGCEGSKFATVTPTNADSVWPMSRFLGCDNDALGVQDARLGPLADNGGSTLTNAIELDSPALGRVTVLAPRRPDSAPQGLPGNRTARAAGTESLGDDPA